MERILDVNRFSYITYLIWIRATYHDLLKSRYIYYILCTYRITIENCELSSWRYFENTNNHIKLVIQLLENKESYWLTINYFTKISENIRVPFFFLSFWWRLMRTWCPEVTDGIYCKVIPIALVLRSKSFIFYLPVWFAWMRVGNIQPLIVSPMTFHGYPWCVARSVNLSKGFIGFNRDISRPISQ